MFDIAVMCEKSDPDQPFEQIVVSDPCSRFEDSYCNTGYKVQPGGQDNSFKRYCLPNGNYSSESFCGGLSSQNWA